MLCSYRPDWQWRNGAEVHRCDRLPPLPPEWYQPASGRRRNVRLQISSLSLSLGILEPMQLVVTLYNQRAERRASESAVIDVRPDHVPLPLVCNFSVWDCVADEMVVVLRLEKVITGDGGLNERDYGSGRAKSTIDNQKKLMRMSKKAEIWSSRFENYRSPLAFAALSLAKALAPGHQMDLYKWKSFETNISEQLVVRASQELLEGETGDRKHIGHASTVVAPTVPPESALCRRCLRDVPGSNDARKLSYSAGDIIR